MTRTTHLAVICLVFLFIISISQGCGEGEEPPPQEASPPSKPQTEEAQGESPPVEEIAENLPAASSVEMEVDAVTSGDGDEIIIENLGYENDKKKSVKLNHKKHSEGYGISCDSCHHVYQNGMNVWKEGDSVRKCVECHDPVEDQENVIKLQSAFHRNCRDCHKDMAQEGKEAPYKKCTDCHG